MREEETDERLEKERKVRGGRGGRMRVEKGKNQGTEKAIRKRKKYCERKKERKRVGVKEER